MREKYKESKLGFVSVALLLLALGVLLIWTRNSPEIIGTAMGLAVIAFGFIYFIMTLFDTIRDYVFVFKIVFSAIFLILGAVIAIMNDKTFDMFAIAIALALIIDGSFKIKTAMMCRRVAVPAWWILLTLALITIAGGFFFIQYPDKNSALIFALGTFSIVGCICNIISIPYLVAYERAEQAEIYYEVYRRDLARNSLNRNPGARQ